MAKDGSALEQLLENEGNPRYDFLRLPYNPTEEQREEHIYYRWRVYSFAQGDGFFVWRSEPFCMFRPHGCFWIPPPMDEDAAQQELDHKRQRENLLRRQKEERVARRDYVTGRQLERARKGGPHGDGRLTRDEMEEFHELFRQNLNASRESICVAMAFCFEKSGAARQIADLLKELLLEDGAAVETRIARLYLLSDILFNSQVSLTFSSDNFFYANKAGSHNDIHDSATGHSECLLVSRCHRALRTRHFHQVKQKQRRYRRANLTE